ncbi:phage integrase N-terminal SAM-like domain-containing protein [Rhodohalobacter mucosus]|uniref:Integrase SAM-like N-terminal domain-containing protein n=1 Tax=Rhodohalobacter mucosus TaxID=2079485 RepID=A0A316TRA8_9BACT|nr:phage integrase N-terminal SAM-like domain-containing protein [Rhodohalobacter mucosus]PWN07133.1 hypothetical protein DDZ15_07670 [Rhodohalobacter mucosus]
MNRSQILSTLRVELRRKGAEYRTEIAIRQWVKKFLKELSITHSRQLMDWQADYFIANLKKDEQYPAAEILQAKSALSFLFEKIIKANGDKDNSYPTEDQFRIPA